jgi:hypothetical protein
VQPGCVFGWLCSLLNKCPRARAYEGQAARGSIQNDAAILCDYNGLDCLTVLNCATDAQRFFTALSHRASAMLPFVDEAALARLLIGPPRSHRPTAGNGVKRIASQLDPPPFIALRRAA